MVNKHISFKERKRAMTEDNFKKYGGMKSVEHHPYSEKKPFKNV